MNQVNKILFHKFHYNLREDLWNSVHLSHKRGTVSNILAHINNHQHMDICTRLVRLTSLV